MMQWWVCKHGAPFDPKWRTIARRVSGRPGDVWAVASALFDAASQAEHRGDISDIDLEQIADGFGYDLDYVQRIFFELKEKGTHDGQLILNFEKHQPKGDTTAAERKARQREREKRQKEERESLERQQASHGMSRVTESDGVTVTVGHAASQAVTGESHDGGRDGHAVTDGHALDKTRPEETIPDQNRPEGESSSSPAREGGSAVSKWRTWRPSDQVSEFWKVIARELRRKAGLKPCDIDREAAIFTSYYAARPEIALDWFQAWVSWVLRADVAKSGDTRTVENQPKAERPLSPDVWNGHPAAATLRTELGVGIFDTWLAPCRLEIGAGLAVLHAPGKLKRDQIASLYMAKLERVFAPLMVAVSLSDDTSFSNVQPVKASDGLDPPAFLIRDPKKVAAA